MLDCRRWEEVRFVATILCSIVKEGKRFDFLPPVCAQRWEEERFVATSLCSIVKDGKKYDLLPPVCARLTKIGRSTICCHQFARLPKMGRSTICCHHFVLDCQRREEVRFLATSLCSKVERSTICCHQFAVLDCQRWEEARFVATSLLSIVKDGKKYDLLPPVCGARLSKMGRSTICCHQFVLA